MSTLNAAPLQASNALVPFAKGAKNLGKMVNAEASFDELADYVLSPLCDMVRRADYDALSDDEKKEKKARNGYWMRANCTGGVRRGKQIEDGRIATLDLDYATPDFLARLNSGGELPGLPGTRFFWHTTASHTDEAPKLRLVVLLDRAISAELYEFVSRLVAARVGIHMVDQVSFRRAQMMFRPVYCHDSGYHDGRCGTRALDVDQLIEDAFEEIFEDRRTWPLAPKEDVPREALKEAQHPHTKSGLVGTFCRAHPSMSEEIETGLLAPYYTPSEYAGGEVRRATYAEATTTDGAVIYGDVWIYSHHGSDPCSDQLVNVFDAVRIHKFGDLDEDTDKKRAMDRRPSYLAMLDYARNDSATNEQKEAELVELLDEPEEDDFDPIGEVSPPTPVRLPSALILEEQERVNDARKAISRELTQKRSGELEPTLSNASVMLGHINSKHGLNLRLNEFAGRNEWKSGVELRNVDLFLIQQMIEKGMPNVGRERTQSAVDVVAQAHAYHPVREYLRGTLWDGTPRLDTWLSRYMRVEDSPYVRAVGAATLVGLVARVMEPGCKHDHMLIVQGEEGLMKSSAFAILGGEWFGDGMPHLQGDKGPEKAAHYCQGYWLIEVAELAGMRKAETNDLKSFLSRGTDKTRRAYKPLEESVPRQFGFVGTTNEHAFLRDDHGNRRFWPVHCLGRVEIEALSRDRDQLWAEALARYDGGAIWHLRPEIEDLAREAQSAVTEEDPFLARLKDFVGHRKKTLDAGGGFELTDALEHVGVTAERAVGNNSKRVGACLRQLGLEPQGRKPRLWKRA